MGVRRIKRAIVKHEAEKISNTRTNHVFNNLWKKYFHKDRIYMVNRNPKGGYSE